MNKVVQGLVAALVLGMAGLAFRLVYFHFATSYIQETVRIAVAPVQAQQQATMARIQVQADAQAQEARQRRAVEAARYMLAADQQCVGGAVIQVHGNEYTQIGSIAQPVHCVGRRADRPLR